MTAMDSYFPFDAGAGSSSTEAAWRSMGQHWLAAGAIAGYNNELEVIGDSSGMQVKLKTGACWVQGHYGEVTAQKTVSISAADPTNPRIDRVVVRADFSGNTVDYAVLTGTPAGSPSAPSLTRSATTWEFSLAQVAVAAAASTITSGNVTDERPLVSAYTAGARFPSTTARDLHITSAQEGMFCYIGADDLPYQYSNSAWRKLYRAAAWTALTLDTGISYVTTQPAYRIVGDRVEFRGDVTFSGTSGSYKTIVASGSLPSAAVPSASRLGVVGTGSGVGALARLTTTIFEIVAYTTGTNNMYLDGLSYAL